MENITFTDEIFFCKIAELITELPTARGLAPRCRDYMCEKTDSPNIVIKSDDFYYEQYEKYTALTEEDINYLEAGWLFYHNLLKFD